MEKIHSSIDESKDYYFPSSFCPLIFFNNQREIVYANKAFREKFGFSNQESVNIVPDFLVTVENYETIPFSKLPIDKLLTEKKIFYYTDENENEFIYKVLTLKNDSDDDVYRALFVEVSDLNDTLTEKTIRALIKASQIKDNDTGNHIERINEYTSALARLLIKKSWIPIFPEVNNDFVKKIGKVAAMHDIGKIGIPDYILTKSSKLTDNEFKIIQEHTINGAFILSEIAGQMARDIALFHHEKWNGTGYPYGLKGDQIPLAARIVTISDVYDALRMKRSYKSAYSHKEAIETITYGKGEHFDPNIVDAFLQINKEFESIFNRMSDEMENLH
jgi:HD-GYP domain-containing protein (c-di-GMP phosphodiesterase class II)